MQTAQNMGVLGKFTVEYMDTLRRAARHRVGALLR
jgi:hypothetical protein